MWLWCVKGKEQIIYGEPEKRLLGELSFFLLGPSANCQHIFLSEARAHVLVRYQTRLAEPERTDLSHTFPTA
jgi:hypothetical protein